jgi:hypothetical protein
LPYTKLSDIILSTIERRDKMKNKAKEKIISVPLHGLTKKLIDNLIDGFVERIDLKIIKVPTCSKCGCDILACTGHNNKAALKKWCKAQKDAGQTL